MFHLTEILFEDHAHIFIKKLKLKLKPQFKLKKKLKKSQSN
jgi:hypothetical protein